MKLANFCKHLVALVFTFFFLSFTSPHKFYTSITQIEYNEKSRSYEIIMNVFWDDWEKALSEYHKKEIRLDMDGIEDFSLKYLESKFMFQHKAKVLKYKMIGLQQEKDIVKIYLELPSKFMKKGMYLKNDCLIAEFENQINIVNLKYKEQKQSLLFKEVNKNQQISW